MPKHTLPKAFEWVYMYADSATGVAGYVGRAKNSERCARRIFEHRSESWYNSTTWELYLYPCINRFESESIETILINRLNPKWNKDKKGWGLPIKDDMTIEPLAHVDEKKLYFSGTTTALIQLENTWKEALIKTGDWQEE